MGWSKWDDFRLLLSDLWRLFWVGFLGATLLGTGMVLGGWPVWLVLWWVLG